MNILLATDASLVRGGISLFMLQWLKGIMLAFLKSNVIIYISGNQSKILRLRRNLRNLKLLSLQVGFRKGLALKINKQI